MADFQTEDLDKFRDAIQSLKLYRRAELESPQGADLIEELYVDPLPHDHVHKLLRQPSTTFLIGRKGTGKSTVFLRAQKSLLADGDVLSTYVDIKTVFESAQVEPALAAKLKRVDGALPDATLNELLLMTSFVRAVVEGIRDDLRKQLSDSWKKRLKQAFSGSYDELSLGLDDFLESLEKPEFTNVQGIRTPQIRDRERAETVKGQTARFKLDPTAGPGFEASIGRSDGQQSESEQEFTDVLLRTVDIRKLILGLKELLEPLGIRHLFVFLDDFSELPLDAMQTVVDVLVAPLNNWSEELVKFKIAAYPGRIYYGLLDKGKIDEVSLDLHSIYGQSSLGEMEEKGTEFTRRLVEKRLAHFGLSFSQFVEPRSAASVWTALFQASLGNPRTLGYILFFVYESQLIYGRRISVNGIREASKRYYEDKIEPYFSMGKFLHETFEEKSTIFSLKELLERLVGRSRELRAKDAASIFRQIDGQHPTSHFNTNPTFDRLLSTLELNFFLTKYYVMSNRDGQRVSVYALNYGLCEKYSITFGRPTGTREQRLYFVERVFDFNPILQDYIASNQEITCDNCGEMFDAEMLDALIKFNMLCPECRVGVCRVVNVSRKYADIIESVQKEQLLPPTELGILQTLNTEPNPQYAADIAGELDVSYQLVGKRAKRLDEQDLVVRSKVSGRREFSLSDSARRIYFGPGEASDLDIPEDPVA